MGSASVKHEFNGRNPFGNRDTNARVVKVDSNSNPASFVAPPGRPLLGDEFTLSDYNFPLFFGLAVQMYESTLVSNDTPLDRFLSGTTSALNAQQKRGLDVFTNQGKCISCHAGAKMIKASVRNVCNQHLERMIMGNGAPESMTIGSTISPSVRPWRILG